MATIREIIERAGKNRPNAYSPEEQLRWLASLEGKLALDVQLLNHSEMGQFNYRYPEDMDTELFIKFPHDDVYYYWLLAQIDKHNNEIPNYENSIEIYNSVLHDYIEWYVSTFRPGQQARSITHYFSAYGLAVQQGFQGTVDQWLQSLIGPIGPKGEPGSMIRIGTVETLPAGSQAEASIGGTAADPVLNLKLPTGPKDVLTLLGGLMQGEIKMGGFRISGLGEPQEDSDAATKSYVDKQGFLFKGAVQDPDSVELSSGLYRITEAVPVHGYSQGLLWMLQAVPGVLGFQLLISAAGDVWCRVLWDGMWQKFRQLSFSYGEALPENAPEGALFLMEG